jgi:apolipoprotein N-acyltransferase
MASAPDLRRTVAAALAVALTAVLTWFGTGLHPWWPLLWFAPLPVLLYAAGASWWRAAIAAAIAWLVGMLGLWHALHDALQLPAAVFAQFAGSEAVAFTLGVLLVRALLRRGAYGWAVVAFPAVRVAFEYLLAIGAPHGTFGSLAYTQVEFLPVLQLASATGPWGITFLVLLLPAALAAAWQLRPRGVQICKDMDFTALSRDYGRAGAALMLVPAWDFGVDGFLHGRMAVMRGVESGFSVVRAARRGTLTVSDHKGRILAEAPSDTSPFATLMARVPAVHAETLYQHLGDWFAWLALAGLALAIGQLLRRRP